MTCIGVNLAVPLVVAACVLFSRGRAAEKPEPPKPASHTVRNIEGWSVHIDDRLLGGPDAGLGRRALRLLGDRLYEIKLVMQPDKLARLQQVPIFLDRTYGKLTSMQYHPNQGWLKANGYASELAKCAHIPDASRFADPKHHHQQPWAVLHELAHAYHDQVLGYENASIKDHWRRIVDSGRFDSVLHVDGRKRKHYALTNQMEFFAEMTEAYFGLNDFYPFQRAELKASEPEVYELMKSVWGPLPGEK
jgi:hypothetical protein